jgi:hypothetical protein
MRRLFTLIVASATVLSVSAQTDNKPATAWKTGGMFSVMGGQSGTRNWTPAGSEKFSLTGAASLNLWANKSWGKNTWENSLDLTYALINTSSLGIRKIDDKIDYYTRFGHALKQPNLSVGIVSSLRTQFTNAYDYAEAPKKRISGFFAPAYLNFSPGIQVKTKDNSFSFHVGPAARWVIVTNSPYSLVNQGGIKPDGTTERTLAEMYGVNPERQVRFEAGLHLSAFFKKEIVKNVMWKTRVEANSDLLESTPGNIDVYWTNNVGMTVNKWLQVTYNFDLYYDDNVKMFGPNKNLAAAQMKSLLGVGLAVKL